MQTEPAGEGRHAYNFFFQKIYRSVHILNRELIIFIMNHGPFQKRFYNIGKRSTPICIYTQLSDSIHYLLSCHHTTFSHQESCSPLAVTLVSACS